MPVEVDDLAARRATLEGEMSIDEMPRLSALCRERISEGIVPFSHDPIRYRLEFRRDAGAALRLRIEVHATVILRCQRCLEPFDYPIDTRSHFRIVRSEKEMQDDSSAFEALLCPEGRLLPQTMIEDEILLALPDFPRHEEDSPPEGASCQAPLPTAGNPPAGESGASNHARSPFARLDALFEKGKSATDPDTPS
ncbi:MAG: DUF177 domain-containing protein [Ectothiorhodospiraceae bacterium AqS1]|nr:DUF177 domain-containing protein [Ectothiorhodospiraceae bacterium AqS1]